MFVTKANVGQVKEITKLLNDYVSFGLAKEKEVLKKIEDENVFVVVFEKKVIGVLVVCKEIKEDYMNILNSTFKNLFKPIIELSLLAVKKEYRKKGIGSLLVSYVLDFYIGFHFFVIGWETPYGWEAKNIIEKNNFIFVEKIYGFWNEVEYSCPHCEKNCNCNALFYFK